MKSVLSLFDYSGNWSDPWRLAGWKVYQIDIKHGQDILTIDLDKYEDVDVILAAPPCTDFSLSGAQYWKQKDSDGTTKQSELLIIKTLEIIAHYNPRIWAIENPVGRLSKLFPMLGEAWYFNPYEYAGWSDIPIEEAYTKRTGLWGQFNIPTKKPVQPIRGNAPIMQYGGNSKHTKEMRSITPQGFSRAFCDANLSGFVF